MSVNVPNIETSANPAVLTGGQFGAKVGYSTAEVIGFYGVTGQAQAAVIATIGNSATGTEIATAVNAIIAVLKNTGLIASA